MKTLLVLITVALAARAAAQTDVPEVKYKTLNELKSTFAFHLACATTSGTPTVQFAYHYTTNSLVPPGNAATLAIYWPGEGLSVHDMPQTFFNPSMPSSTYPWTLTYPDADTLDVAAALGTLPSGGIHFTLKNGSSGRFKMHLKYIPAANEIFEWDLRCAATNYTKSL